MLPIPDGIVLSVLNDIRERGHAEGKVELGGGKVAALIETE